jgi:hypothetical protein
LGRPATPRGIFAKVAYPSAKDPRRRPPCRAAQRWARRTLRLRAEPRPNVLLRVAETKRRMRARREDKGASAGGLTWGGASRSRELRPESDPLFLAPLLALFHPGCLVRERPESGGIGCCLRPTPTLRPHCPIYSSSDPTASGEALTRSTYRGAQRREFGESKTPRHPSRKTYGLEESAACNAGRRVDDVLDAGPRRRRRTGESLRHPPPAARVARPRHFTVTHQFRGFQCSLQRANGPVGRINAERPDGPPADDAA